MYNKTYCGTVGDKIKKSSLLIDDSIDTEALYGTYESYGSQDVWKI